MNLRYVPTISNSLEFDFATYLRYRTRWPSAGRAGRVDFACPAGRFAGGQVQIDPPDRPAIPFKSTSKLQKSGGKAGRVDLGRVEKLQ